MASGISVDHWDITVLVLYFVSFYIVGIYSMFKSMKNTSTDFFLAGRFMTWLPVGASIFASNIGSEHFIGLSGSGAAKGIGVSAFEFNASMLLMLLGWFFLPVFIMSGASTLPQYMKKRFNSPRIQLFLAFFSLIMYVFTKISVNLFAGYIFIHEAFGWNIWLSVLFILAVTACITVIGGLVAVLYTDTFQCIVMLIGSIILCIKSFIEVGGMQGLLDNYGSAFGSYNLTSDLTKSLINALTEKTKHSIANSEIYDHGILNEVFRNKSLKSLTCGFPNDNAFTMLREYNDDHLPWAAFIFGHTPCLVWYWCTDQMMVQRVLASKDISHAQGATTFAGILKQLPIFLMIFPGMISRILYPDIIGCATPEDCIVACGQATGCSNLAYPFLIMRLMPSGLRGLMLSVMLAALVSDLTSIFNSSSTIFSIDIYTKIRKNAKSKELIFVARLFIIALIGASLAWVPIIQGFQGGQLFIYITVITSFLVPPISAVFIVALLLKDTTELAAFSTLVIGFIIGAIRMILEFVYPEPNCGEKDTRPQILSDIHYMYFGLILFVISLMILVGVTKLEKLLKKKKNPLLGKISTATESEIKRDFSRLTFISVLKEWKSFDNIDDEQAKLIKNQVEEEELSRAEELAKYIPKMTITEKIKDFFWPTETIRKNPEFATSLEDVNVGTVIRSGNNISDVEDKKMIIRMRQTKCQRYTLFSIIFPLIFLTCFLYAFYTLYYDFRTLGPLKVTLKNDSAITNNKKPYIGDPKYILKGMNLTDEMVNNIIFLNEKNLLDFTIPY